MVGWLHSTATEAETRARKTGAEAPVFDGPREAESPIAISSPAPAQRSLSSSLPRPSLQALQPERPRPSAA